MPFFTDWELDELAASGIDAQSAWASGDWDALAAALLDHAARTGELGMVSRLLEQEARNDERSMLVPQAQRILALPDGTLKSTALALAAVQRGQSATPLFLALDALEADEPGTAAMVALCMGWRFADRALWPEASRFDGIALRAVERLRAAGAPAEHVDRLWMSAMAVHAFLVWSAEGDDGPAEQLSEALAELRSRNRLGRPHGLPLTVLGRIHAGRGDWHRAALHLAQGVHLTPANATETAATAKAMLVLARYRQGDWHGADVESESAQALIAGSGSTTLTAIRSALEALQLSLAGDGPGAMLAVDACRRALVERRSIIAEALLLHARIMLTIAAQEWGALHALLDVEHDPGYPRLYSPHEWFGLQALALHGVGDTTRHRALLERWHGEPGAEGSALFWAHRGLLAEAEGDDRAALATIERMRARLDLDEDPLGRAWVHWVIGSLEERHRDVADGRREHELARTAFARLGAGRFAELAAQLIRRSDALPPRETLAALDALTPQQRRVAELVAEGWTSAEIAAQLFLSKRTIDFHVGNVLDRLGLTNRREIKRVIDASARR